MPELEGEFFPLRPAPLPHAPLGWTLTRSRGRSPQATPPLSRSFHMPPLPVTFRPACRSCRYTRPGRLLPCRPTRPGPPLARPRHRAARQGPGRAALWAQAALPLPHGSPDGLVRPRAGAQRPAVTASRGTELPLGCPGDRGCLVGDTHSAALGCHAGPRGHQADSLSAGDEA